MLDFTAMYLDSIKAKNSKDEVYYKIILLFTIYENGIRKYSYQMGVFATEEQYEYALSSLKPEDKVIARFIPNKKGNVKLIDIDLADPSEK